MAEDKEVVEGKKEESTSSKNPVAVKKKKGFISRIWNGIFGFGRDDFEKRLQYIHKEEAIILARIKRRTQTWRKVTRNIIMVTVVFEV